MNFSSRIKSVEASTIMELLTYAEEAKKQGKKVYYLNIGQPDIKTPENFFKAIANDKENVLEYALSEGLPELRKAIQKYYKEYDINFDIEDILILNGGSEALFFTMLTICNEGDNILVPEPFYSNYNSFANAVGVQIKPITTLAENGFHLPSKEEIVSKIDKNTRAILFSNPGNPTGVVYTKEEIKMIS
ncbi:MAG: aminotransferase class I/II-fold pyridoxal phosphate-dependent enzyme, partial [Paeniclostridium sordellii]|nr:aminotransferase class I/II-fold pyridoxal phosphate-dependent enzyme [Paeniclostridium sordellii]